MGPERVMAVLGATSTSLQFYSAPSLAPSHPHTHTLAHSHTHTPERVIVVPTAMSMSAWFGN